jgi:hypothetical protein
MLAAILAPLWYGYMAKRRGRNIIGWAFIGLVVFGVLKLLTVLVVVNATPATESEATSLTLLLNIFLFGGVLFGGFLIPRVRPNADASSIGVARQVIGDFRAPQNIAESVSIHLASTKRYHDLFNRQLYGINLYFALCLFIGMILSTLAWYGIYSTAYDQPIFPKTSVWVRHVVMYAISALLFLALSHSISRYWFFSLVWGVIGLCRLFMSGIAGQLIEGKTLDLTYLLKPETLIQVFVSDVVYALAIIMSVRVAGAKPWIFVLVLTLVNAIHGTIFRLLFESDIPWRLQDGAFWLADGVLMGTLVYLGLYLSLRRKPMRAGV